MHKSIPGGLASRSVRLAVDAEAAFHDRAASRLTARLNCNRRVGMPWESLAAFVRIATHPGAAARPLTPDAAWPHVDDWLGAPGARIPLPTADHQRVPGDLIGRYRLAGNLIPDAHQAALAIELGLDVCSVDTDFTRFAEVRWLNPLA